MRCGYCTNHQAIPNQRERLIEVAQFFNAKLFCKNYPKFPFQPEGEFYLLEIIWIDQVRSGNSSLQSRFTKQIVVKVSARDQVVEIGKELVKIGFEQLDDQEKWWEAFGKAFMNASDHDMEYGREIEFETNSLPSKTVQVMTEIATSHHTAGLDSFNIRNVVEFMSKNLERFGLESIKDLKDSVGEFNYFGVKLPGIVRTYRLYQSQEYDVYVEWYLVTTILGSFLVLPGTRTNEGPRIFDERCWEFMSSQRSAIMEAQPFSWINFQNYPRIGSAQITMGGGSYCGCGSSCGCH